MREAYGKDGNGHLKEKMNSLLVGLRIIKRVREPYGRDNNEHLKEKMNPFTNKK